VLRADHLAVGCDGDATLKSLGVRRPEMSDATITSNIYISRAGLVRALPRAARVTTPNASAVAALASAERSHVPAAKSIPIKIRKSGGDGCDSTTALINTECG